MHPGRMDQRITLQARVESGDGAGGIRVEWQDQASDARPWAAVTAKSGRETVMEGRVNATFVVLFTIYNRADLTEKHRIVWNNVIYNIMGIRHEGARAQHLVIEAERGVQP